MPTGYDHQIRGFNFFDKSAGEKSAYSMLAPRGNQIRINQVHIDDAVNVVRDPVNLLVMHLRENVSVP